MTKHIFLVLTSLLCLFALCFSASADSLKTAPTLLDSADTTVVFREDTPFTAEQQQRIRFYLLTGEDLNDNGTAQTQGLLCKMFDHKYEYNDKVTTVYHREVKVPPRCHEVINLVYMCSRCGDMYTTFYDEDYIFCCPADA